MNSDYFVPPPPPINSATFQTTSPDVNPKTSDSDFAQASKTVQTTAPIVINSKNWSGGAWLIMLSAGLAILSFILPWQDIGILSANGFRLGMFFLGILFAYPVWANAANCSMNKIAAYLCAALGIVSGIAYIPLKCYAKLFDEEELIAGTGVYTFIVSCFVLALGIFLYRRTESGSSEHSPISPIASNADILHNPKITACLGFVFGLLVMYGICSVDFQREIPK